MRPGGRMVVTAFVFDAPLTAWAVRASGVDSDSFGGGARTDYLATIRAAGLVDVEIWGQELQRDRARSPPESVWREQGPRASTSKVGARGSLVDDPRPEPVELLVGAAGKITARPIRSVIAFRCLVAGTITGEELMDTAHALGPHTPTDCRPIDTP